MLNLLLYLHLRNTTFCYETLDGADWWVLICLITSFSIGHCWLVPDVSVANELASQPLQILVTVVSVAVACSVLSETLHLYRSAMGNSCTCSHQACCVYFSRRKSHTCSAAATITNISSIADLFRSINISTLSYHAKHSESCHDWTNFLEFLAITFQLVILVTLSICIKQKAYL